MENVWVLHCHKPLKNPLEIIRNPNQDIRMGEKQSELDATAKPKKYVGLYILFS